ncbi:hypothetical protein HDV00_001040 [Rhizophlyctis rosea]|nr:hypothetical protein HDV00_001040 [Rhizophlyctis rosea]
MMGTALDWAVAGFTAQQLSPQVFEIIPMLVAPGGKLQTQTLFSAVSQWPGPLSLTAHNIHDHDNPQRLELISTLLELGANPNGYGDSHSLLHWAVILGSCKLVETLVRGGADVDFEGGMPLLTAIKQGNDRIIKLLLRSGADVNVKNHHGRTSLHLAAGNRDREIVRLLLKHGADINIRDRLVRYGGDVNMTDHDGRTPLHIAADTLNHPMVELLLDVGADVRITDRQGRDALAIAQRRLGRKDGDERMLDILRRALRRALRHA